MQPEKQPFGKLARLELPKPYEVCEVIGQHHEMQLAEWDSYFKSWFDLEGNQISSVWLWRYKQEQ